MSETGKLSLQRLWVLMVTAFVDLLGFALILPLLPFYATRFGGDAATVGVLVGIFALAQMVTGPLWGRLSDRWGRRSVLLGAQLLSMAAYVAFAYADSVLVLLVSRFLQGAGGGTTERDRGLCVGRCRARGARQGPGLDHRLLALGLGMVAPLAASPAQFLLAILLIPAGTAMLFPATTSLISRYADPDHAGQTLGVQQAFGGLSRLLGPVWAGAVFQAMGEAVPYWLAGALVFATALFALRLHPGEKPRQDSHK